MQNEKKLKKDALRIAGMPLPLYLFCFLIFAVGVVTDVLPDNLLTGIAFATLAGYLLTWLGNTTKFGRTIGLPVLLCMLVPAFLVYFGVVPESISGLMANFLNGYNFLEVFIAALMTGSILGMDATLLRKAIVRYMLPVLAALFTAMLVAGAMGAMTGYGFRDAILTIALPICGAGTGAGAVPMSQIYANTMGGDPADYLSAMVPAVTIANVLCILLAAAYNAVGKNPDKPFKGFSGQGKIMQAGVKGFDYAGEKQVQPTYEKMAVGLMVSAAFYMLGTLLNKLVWAEVHTYAWVCILLIVFKLSGLCPQFLQESCTAWNDFVAGWGTIPTIFATGMVNLNIKSIISVITNPMYFVIIVIIVAVIAVVAGGVGYLLKMNFVESSITAGLCMANSGGGGDIMVLGAADRMNLMPFAQISSRIGGSIILIIASFAAKLLS